MVEPAARYLVDISRLISRAGVGTHTGIDRVELAYVSHFLTLGQPVHFLSRGLGGYAVLRRDGMARLMPHLAGEEPWGPKDMLSRLGARQSQALQRAEATMRRLSAAQTPRPALGAMLRRRIGPGFVYLNVGHSNQARSTLEAIRQGGARLTVLMIHDLIPLEYPEFARPGGAERFATKLKGAVGQSDALIFNSSDTERRARRWLGQWDLDKASTTAHLGIEPQLAAVAPPRTSEGHPYFVMLGTIEPRKNHLLILNLWRRFHDSLPAEKTPHLHIVGRRGWENENILDQLDRAPFMGKTVFERGTLPDDALGPLLAGARGLLFPSFAEGYGYPLIEALAQGARVFASDLPVFREVAGNHPTYLDPLNGTAWGEAILAAAKTPPPRGPRFVPPSWSDHFQTIHRFLEALLENRL